MGEFMSRYPTSSRVKKRVEHRWLRSDGKPNLSDRIYSLPREIEIIAKKPVLSITPSTPIGKAVEIMASSYRSLVVAFGDELKGLLLASSIVNYLGGGEYFNIIAERYKYNVFSAFSKEPVESIMIRDPIVAFLDDDLVSVLEKMIIHGVGVLPVVDREYRIHGVISEHDLVNYLKGVIKLGVKVRNVMSTPVVYIDVNTSLKTAMESMVKFGFRRLPIVEKDVVVGLVTVMDIIKYFTPSNIFKQVSTGDIREVLNKNIAEVMTRDLVTAKPDDDLVVVVNEMLNKNVSSALVVDDNDRLIGIVTERDVLYALTTA